MANLIKKKKGNRLYYSLVESARVDGPPRIVHQAYLGTAEKVAELIEQKSAPVPLSGTLRWRRIPLIDGRSCIESEIEKLTSESRSKPGSAPEPGLLCRVSDLHPMNEKA